MDILWISVFVAAVALIVTALSGFIVIPAMKRLKLGQTILDIGPIWHKEKKQGIPTMGGIMFIIGIAVAFASGLVLLWLNGYISFEGAGGTHLFGSISGFIMAVCMGFVGFLDDFIKVSKKRNEGLTPNQKIIMQVFIIAAYFTARIISGDTNTVITIPYVCQLDLWYFYYILMGLGIIYLVNAVNLTDGIDGLCSSVVFVFCGVYLFICTMLGFTELSVLSVAVGGGCLGFLIWNFYPAKIIMGDTGSMFFGGIVVALGIGTHTEILMIIAGGVFIWEAVTVIIQMTYFKITHGKRLFKMTPIHHSFEMRGWKEIKIVVVFSLLAAVLGAAAVMLVSGL